MTNEEIVERFSIIMIPSKEDYKAIFRPIFSELGEDMNEKQKIIIDDCMDEIFKIGRSLTIKASLKFYSIEQMVALITFNEANPWARALNRQISEECQTALQEECKAISKKMIEQLEGAEDEED